MYNTYTESWLTKEIQRRIEKRLVGRLRASVRVEYSLTLHAFQVTISCLGCYALHNIEPLSLEHGIESAINYILPQLVRTLGEELFLGKIET